MTLFPKAKTAIVSRFRNPPPAYAHGTAFLSVRKSIADARRSAEWLGIETVDGRRAEGFRFKHGDGERTVWADPKTSFPIRVEEVSLVGSNETCTIMTDFQFNLDLDESLFGLDVPAGYAIRTMQVDFSKQPIDYFVDSLRFAAEHNDGLFPPTLLGEQGLADTVRRAIAALEKAHGQDSPEMFDLGGEIAMNKDKAFAFLSNLSPKSDWHYVGRDVKLYTPGKPIFWHKPMGTVNYRVVCADLKVKELSLDAFQFPFGPPATRLGDDQFEVAFSYRPDKKVQSVYLAGSFNNWKPMAHKMDGPDEDGSFTALLKLKQGTYEYKFVLDGHTWETDPNNIWQSGRNGNSEAHVGLLFGSVGKPLGDDQFEVAFSYRPDKKVQSVYLAGSFNNWKPMAHKMDGPDKDGRFTTLLKLKQGTYEYKFVLDGQIWEADPDNTWRTSWYQNSLLYVGNPP
jgi:hypothetical protein